MSKGTIKENKGSGLYSVELNYYRARYEEQEARLNGQISTADANIVILQAEYDAAVAATDAQQVVLDAAIVTYNNNKNVSTYKAVQTETEALKDRRLEQTDALVRLRSVELSRESAVKGLEHLGRELPAEDPTVDAWCADHNLDLAVDYEVGVVDIVRQKDKASPIIFPAGVDGTEAAFDATRDGQFEHMSIANANAAYYNTAMLPGYNKWKPRYRLGEITAINYGTDTIDVLLDDATSTAQNIDVNQSETVSADTSYLTCNSRAFVLGDRVVVAFVGQDWLEPQVIGFESNPRACFTVPLQFYFEQGDGSVNSKLRRVTFNPSDLSIDTDTLVNTQPDVVGHELFGGHIHKDKIVGGRGIGTYNSYASEKYALRGFVEDIDGATYPNFSDYWQGSLSFPWAYEADRKYTWACTDGTYQYVVYEVFRFEVDPESDPDWPFWVRLDKRNMSGTLVNRYDLYTGTRYQDRYDSLNYFKYHWGAANSSKLITVRHKPLNGGIFGGAKYDVVILNQDGSVYKALSDITYANAGSLSDTPAQDMFNVAADDNNFFILDIFKPSGGSHVDVMYVYDSSGDLLNTQYVPEIRFNFSSPPSHLNPSGATYSTRLSSDGETLTVWNIAQYAIDNQAGEGNTFYRFGISRYKVLSDGTLTLIDQSDNQAQEDSLEIVGVSGWPYFGGTIELEEE